MTVLATEFRSQLRGTDTFIEALIDALGPVEREGQTLYVSIRGGGETADVYGMALEYPQTDVGITLIDRDADAMKRITTAVNAPVGTYYVTDSLPEMTGRMTEAQTIREGYEASSGSVRVPVRATRSEYQVSDDRLSRQDRADGLLRVRRTIGPASDNAGTVGELVFEQDGDELRFIDFDAR